MVSTDSTALSVVLGETICFARNGRGRYLILSVKDLADANPTQCHMHLDIVEEVEDIGYSSDRSHRQARRGVDCIQKWCFIRPTLKQCEVRGLTSAPLDNISGCSSGNCLHLFVLLLAMH